MFETSELMELTSQDIYKEAKDRKLKGLNVTVGKGARTTAGCSERATVSIDGAPL
jgi:hypothetical protein